MNLNELNKIIKLHQLWLNHHPAGKRADLAGVNLSYANLHKANLSYANLSYANLSRTNLSYADLSRVNLSYANLSYTDLSYANIAQTNLSGANLTYADLSGANLSCACLSAATLSRTNLHKANLFQANLNRANLSWADLSYATLSQADLSEANLHRTNLFEANLSLVDLYRATLTEANLCKAKLQGANLQETYGLVKIMGVAPGGIYWKRFRTGLVNNNYKFKLGLNKLRLGEIFAADERCTCTFPGFHFASRSWCAVNYPGRPLEARIQIPLDAKINEPWATDGKASADRIIILEVYDTATGKDVTKNFRPKNGSKRTK